jgi:hypothetical protein
MIAFTLAFVLVFLSGLHIYWAFGGRWGWSVAIPQINKRAAFSPSRFATVIVAFGLATAALVPLVRTGTLSIPAPLWLSQWSAGLLSLVFCMRAVGDFRLVGFFKRVRGTPFAIWDTRLFSPLCLLLAAGFARVATLSHGRERSPELESRHVIDTRTQYLRHGSLGCRISGARIGTRRRDLSRPLG